MTREREAALKQYRAQSKTITRLVASRALAIAELKEGCLHEERVPSGYLNVEHCAFCPKEFFIKVSGGSK
jgi:hypothetical protein